MSGKLSRRAIYIGTAVAIVATIGGFAVAALYQPLTMSYNGNQGSATASNTIYGAGGSTSSQNFLVDNSAPGTCTASTPSGSTTETIWMAGASAAHCAAGDYYVELTFVSPTETASTSYTDTFTVTLGLGASATYYSSSQSLTCTQGLTAATCTAHVNIDTGVANSAVQPVVDSVEVTITGN
jgi:hypothetical protein